VLVDDTHASVLADDTHASDSSDEGLMCLQLPANSLVHAAAAVPCAGYTGDA
jgi:hypothetical protein